MNNKRFIIVVIILTVTGIIGDMSYSPLPNKNMEHLRIADFPKKINGWASEDIPLSKQIYESMESNNVIMRNYEDKEGKAVNLCIIYSLDNRKIGPPPEIFLPREGLTITDKSILQISEDITATTLITEKGASWELTVYWYKVGGINTDDYLIRLAINRLLGRKTPVALIRVSTEIDDKQDIVLRRIIDFCLLIEPLLNKYVP
jgi:EpsI family protein